MELKPDVKLYFTDYFGVEKDKLDQHGAFDISLVSDLPLFIDPFLLFQSSKPDYKVLHKKIIDYLVYLRDYSLSHTINQGKLRELFVFPEVKQNYLGWTFMGNSGRGLGLKFARALNSNLSELFKNFGSETITLDKHLEKLCLISRGVGRDMISDFVTNLVKEYLLEYTQEFSVLNIKDTLLSEFNVEKVKFDPELGIWITGKFILPVFKNNYVLLTPKDLLTRDKNWICRTDYIDDFFRIVSASPNQQLQADLDEYLKRVLKKEPTKEEKEDAIESFTRQHPELIDYYIRYKEDNGERAVKRSAAFVEESQYFFNKQFGDFIHYLWNQTEFYKIGFITKPETYNRIAYLKDLIENKGCWKIFYNQDKPIAREEDVHVLFRLVWCGTILDVSREVNDGIGPADFKISNGKNDKTLVEFKLASNSQLKKQLIKQLELYKKASDAEYGYKVIVYFSNKELEKLNVMLRELKMENDKNIILIDASKKISASKAS